MMWSMQEKAVSDLAPAYTASVRLHLHLHLLPSWQLSPPTAADDPLHRLMNDKGKHPLTPIQMVHRMREAMIRKRPKVTCKNPIRIVNMPNTLWEYSQHTW